MSRRVVGAVVGTVTGVVLLVGAKSGPGASHATVVLGSPTAGGPSPTPAPSSTADGQAGSAAGSGGAATPTPTAASSAAPTPSATARAASTSGTFTGADVSTQFGDVQVQVTIAGGRLTDVTALTLPSEHFRSQEINNYAAPILRSEALAAQNAQIDVVSGATITSDAYAQSLQAALDAAHR